MPRSGGERKHWENIAFLPGGRSTKASFPALRHPHYILRTPPFSAGACAHLFHLERGLTKPSGERGIRDARPDGEHSARAKSIVDRAQAGSVVELAVVLVGECARRGVDVQQDGVESRPSSLMTRATSPSITNVRGSSSGCPASEARGPRFQVTTAGTSSATTASPRAPIPRNAAASV